MKKKLFLFSLSRFPTLSYNDCHDGKASIFTIELNISISIIILPVACDIAMKI
jgi:hypothetical protein